MARARNIKPGFFKNEDLAELPMAARMLFAGLWCMADREGRMEDRPKRIKIEVLPYDDIDVDALLQVLHDAGFIQRYLVDGACLIQVCKWHKHQRPHHKEIESELPPPNQADSHERAKHEPSTDQARAEHDNPGESSPRNDRSDTGYLIPDTKEHPPYHAQARDGPADQQAKSISSNGETPVAAGLAPAEDGSASPPGPASIDRGGGGIEMTLGRWQPGQAEVDALRMAGIALRIEAEDVAAFTTHYAGRWMAHHEIHRKFVKWMIRKKQYADERGGANNGKTGTGHHSQCRQSATERFWERRRGEVVDSG